MKQKIYKFLMHQLFVLNSGNMIFSFSWQSTFQTMFQKLMKASFTILSCILVCYELRLSKGCVYSPRALWMIDFITLHTYQVGNLFRPVTGYYAFTKLTFLHTVCVSLYDMVCLSCILNFESQSYTKKKARDTLET